MKNVNLWGGQFKPAQEGLFKSAKGGLYDRIFQLIPLISNFANSHPSAHNTILIVGYLEAHIAF